jgi:hypothetical protein
MTNLNHPGKIFRLAPTKNPVLLMLNLRLKHELQIFKRRFHEIYHKYFSKHWCITIFFLRSDEQTEKIDHILRKVLGASNAFRFVLNTVRPCPAMHSRARPLYPNRFPCAPAFTPERSRDQPSGPRCTHESSCGLLLYKIMICVLHVDVNHYFEPSCFSFVFQK